MRKQCWNAPTCYTECHFRLFFELKCILHEAAEEYFSKYFSKDLNKWDNPLSSVHMLMPILMKYTVKENKGGWYHRRQSKTSGFRACMMQDRHILPLKKCCTVSPLPEMLTQRQALLLRRVHPLGINLPLWPGDLMRTPHYLSCKPLFYFCLPSAEKISSIPVKLQHRSEQLMSHQDVILKLWKNVSGYEFYLQSNNSRWAFSACCSALQQPADSNMFLNLRSSMCCFFFICSLFK